MELQDLRIGNYYQITDNAHARLAEYRGWNIWNIRINRILRQPCKIEVQTKNLSFYLKPEDLDHETT